MLALLVTASGPVRAEDGELAIRNPGFETDADGDHLPDGWTFAWRATHSGESATETRKHEPDWGWDHQVKHSGQASIRCGVARPEDDGVWTQDDIVLPAGAKFIRVAAWICARQVHGGMGNVALVFFSSKGRWLGAAYGAISATQDCDWTPYVGYARVPQGAARMRLRCWVNLRYQGTGTFWFDDLEAKVVGEMPQPRTLYLDDAAPPLPTAAERAAGFLLFSRPATRLIFPSTVPSPDERVATLSLVACPGEYEPSVLAVRALRDLSGLRVEVGDLVGPAGRIPAAAVDVRSVRYHLKQGQARWGPFNETLMEVPLFLEKRSSLEVSAGSNRPFWLTVHVPPQAMPGRYEGTVRILADGSPGARVPLKLRVRPFRLAEPRGVTFAMYTRMRAERAWVRETFADMRAHGLTSVALCGNSGLSLKLADAEVRVEFTGKSPLEINMDEYSRAGFPEPVVWLMGGDLPAFCERLAPLESDKFAAAFRSVVAAILEHGRQVGWPQIIFQPVDEPVEHAAKLPRALRLLRILKTIPGLRTEEDGMNGRWENFTDEFYRLSDVLVLHDGPTLHRGRVDMTQWQDFLARARADGKNLWFYNIDLTGWHPEPVRFMTGFGLWKSGAKGIIEWAYMFPVREDKPEAVYHNPRALLYRFPPAPGESGGPCIAYEAVREGIDDYRYLLTLNQLVQQARRSGNPELVALADRLWAPVQAKLDQATFEGCRGKAGQGDWTGKCEFLPDGNRAVRGDHKINNNWSLSDYDSLREQISSAIEQLREALGAKP